MTYILLASSTAGHICPCIETAEFLKKHQKKVLIVAEKKKIPLLLLKGNDVIFIEELKNFKSYSNALKALSKYDKDTAIISFGGKISGIFPLLYILGYRNLFSYELNKVMGKANKLARLFVKKTYSYFPLKEKRKVEVIGHPQENRIVKNNLNKDGKKILILTGSNGSEEVYRIFDNLKLKYPELDLTISEPFKGYEFKSKIKRKPFLNSNFYQDYDLIISRAGAGSIVDILRQNIPLILFPSTYVKDDHQNANTNYLNKLLGIKIIDKKLDEKELFEIIQNELIYQRRKELVEQYSKFQHDYVLQKLLEDVENANRK